jgi:hypothetical protein
MGVLNLTERFGATVGLEHLVAVLLAGSPDFPTRSAVGVDDEDFSKRFDYRSHSLTILTDLKDC